MIDCCPKHGPFSTQKMGDCPSCAKEAKPEPPSTAVAAGEDLAKLKDYAAFVSLTITDKVARVKRVYTWPHTDYSIVMADTKLFYDEDEARVLGVDQGNAGEPIIEQYQTMGMKVEPVLFTLASKNDMINFTRSLLQRRLKHTPPYLELPKGGPFIDELKTQIKEQERIVGAAEIPKYDQPSGRHDDLLWALNIACWMARPWLTNPVWGIMARHFPSWEGVHQV